MSFWPTRNSGRSSCGDRPQTAMIGSLSFMLQIMTRVPGPFIDFARFGKSPLCQDKHGLGRACHVLFGFFMESLCQEADGTEEERKYREAHARPCLSSKCASCCNRAFVARSLVRRGSALLLYRDVTSADRGRPLLQDSTADPCCTRFCP